MSSYLPERCPKSAYSSVVGNPDRTCQELWGDLVKGGSFFLGKMRAFGGPADGISAGFCDPERFHA